MARRILEFIWVKTPRPVTSLPRLLGIHIVGENRGVVDVADLVGFRTVDRRLDAGNGGTVGPR